MTFQRHFFFLFLFVLSTFVAIAVFKYLDNRVLAGLVAGITFVLVGISYLWQLTRYLDYFKKLSFYPAFLHVFIFAIPMMAKRQMSPEIPMEDLMIFGVSGPIFHRLSESVFLTLMVFTLFDALISLKRSHRDE